MEHPGLTFRLAAGLRGEAARWRSCWNRESERAASQEAAAQVERAQASVTNLRKGKRPDEIAAMQAQRRYNPEGISRYNIVPGLIGVILTMTMVMMTSLAIPRERERGTMENLLATPVRPRHA